MGQLTQKKYAFKEKIQGSLKATSVSGILFLFAHYTHNLDISRSNNKAFIH